MYVCMYVFMYVCLLIGFLRTYSNDFCITLPKFCMFKKDDGNKFLGKILSCPTWVIFTPFWAEKVCFFLGMCTTEFFMKFCTMLGQ